MLEKVRGQLGDSENSEKEFEGPGDGQTSIDCRVPVHRMLMSYRVPGRLRVKHARGNQWAKSMSDEYMV